MLLPCLINVVVESELTDHIRHYRKIRQNTQVQSPENFCLKTFSKSIVPFWRIIFPGIHRFTSPGLNCQQTMSREGRLVPHIPMTRRYPISLWLFHPVLSTYPYGRRVGEPLVPWTLSIGSCRITPEVWGPPGCQAGEVIPSFLCTGWKYPPSDQLQEYPTPLVAMQSYHTL